LSLQFHRIMFVFQNGMSFPLFPLAMVLDEVLAD